MKNKYYSRTEINQRDGNEDYHRVFPIAYDPHELPITFLVVADGMGGHEHGEDVSYQAVLKIEDFLKKELTPINNSQEGDSLTIETLKRALLSAVESASSLVRRMIQVNGWKKAGSTIVVAAIWQDQAIAVNLGDSPLFHYMASLGKVVRVTQDHSVPGVLAQAKLITEEMARYHERRGQLEFYLGADKMPSPEPVYEMTLAAGDLLLLCSDGISGLLNLDQIEAILAQTQTSLAQKAEQLIQAARVAGETDNQTLILWRYEESVHTRQSIQSSSQVGSAIALPFSTIPSQSTLHRQETFEQSVEQNSEDVNSRALAVPDQQLSTRTTFTNKQRHLPNQTLFRNKKWVLFGLTGGVIAAVAIAYLTLLPMLKSLLKLTTNFSAQCPSPLPGQKIQNGLMIECFKSDGSVLITKSQDGSQIAWNVQFVRGSTNRCSSAVPSEYQAQQNINRVEPEQGVPQQLYTSNINEGCRRLWTRQDSRTNTPGEERITPPSQSRGRLTEVKIIELAPVNTKGEDDAVFKLRSQRTFS